MHLEQVGELARDLAAAFDSAEWGHLAGRWHDLGKYRPEFQRRIRGSGEHAPHASIGAALAAERRLAPLAFAIAGHHAGLANRVEQVEGGPLPLRTALEDGRAVLASLRATLPGRFTNDSTPTLPAHLRQQPGPAGGGQSAIELWTRFLFSALVDADRLATEAFYDPDRRALAGDFDPIPVLRARLDATLDAFRANSPVNALRAGILADCRSAALHDPGLFSLTVPTGGGKTLSSMAFALQHAERHGLRRVIVVVPYTSIIEQNAAVYRHVLGDRNVIEHHSAIDEATRREEDGELEARRCLAAENWDAPLVVTTSVQFFESLFSNHPSRCRKLHNVARSVVIIDEAQALPTQFLLCILDVMRELVRGYGSSLVLSTATQPALLRRPSLEAGLTGVREIMADPDALAHALQRVEVEWPVPDAPPTPYAEVAAKLAEQRQVLAVVHLRKDARDLATALPCEHRVHLSTNMCAAHRLATLGRIRAALAAGDACRVVSTQLVEAGVDLDFPVVYRAMAGLDSLAQAAGRCNRNGTLADSEGRPARGRFVVFRAETLPPRGVLRKGLEAADTMLRARGGVIDFTDPETLEEYFRRLYMASSLDPEGVMPHRDALNFATVAKLVKLVDDGGSHPLIVPWEDSAERVARFNRAPNRETARALQPFVVQVRDRELAALRVLGAVADVPGFGFALSPPYLHLYDAEFGLLAADDAGADPSGLVV